MAHKSREVLFGPAILKLSFVLKNMQNDPGFKMVYQGILKDKGLTDKEVSDYIAENEAELRAHIQKKQESFV
jgi:hypothetical protein